MGHSVRLVIGRGDAIAAFLRAWPGSRAVDLQGGWQAIPVEDALHGAIAARYPEAVRPDALDFAPPGLDAALAEATAAGGALAYVETEYFGGTGGQSAMAYADGLAKMEPARAQWAGPINQALRRIGVAPEGETDAFDTIGLGERRHMADYEPEGPVRLRGGAAADAAVEPAVAPVAEVEKAHVPLWKVALVIAAMIAVGVFIAVANP
ncbi:MAG: hypothetical protein B7Y90_12950 [Alphaproteobacteria bacterium 32-64-14]|nr:MAG: hypothetical protein B7Y90_12950 [Alphaproteobacteria bacterium 32-64-14]